MDIQSLQKFAMRKFICIDEVAEIGPMTNFVAACAYQDYPVCDWHGVTCDTDDVVRDIEWTTGVGLSFDMDFIPQTVRQLALMDARSNNTTPFSTRKLPRDLKHCYLVHCDLRGCLNMATLPSNLIDINVQNNRLSGTVSLLEIPRSLQSIDLRSNAFDELIISDAALDQMSTINLYQRLKVMQVVSIDGNIQSGKISFKPRGT